VRVNFPLLLTPSRQGRENPGGIAELVPSKTRNLTPRNGTTDCQSLFKLKMSCDSILRSVQHLSELDQPLYPFSTLATRMLIDVRLGIVPTSLSVYRT